ncbi:MAG: transglutaminase-like cysteine peptidase [Kordiimonadaceae bacterium]|nr:transglutaminase-like cysteine peptidase [Kordiimonadaceae bacterium]MBO6570484.1 transglutaminase-like cysteine peptidase [Kordiimonadaceae bacterium]MBO6966397.1 transglutaminase-like cysteine peptidase [Kordiimonadaceae bacterium]
MPKGTIANPHQGFVELCAREPEQCVVPLTKETREDLINLHQKTRDLIVPTIEEGDSWTTLSQVGPGDCEDFALTLRSLLRQHMPEYAGAFRIATAFTEQFQYHAVITLETDEGTLVCDIRYPKCGTWDAFPYEWHLREIVGNANWENIGDEKALADARAASIQLSGAR